MTINGYRCYGDGGSLTGDDIPTGFYVCPPLNTSGFGNGDKAVFELPIHDKNADSGHTNYPEPVDTLRYEFTIDGRTLEPLETDN